MVGGVSNPKYDLRAIKRAFSEESQLRMTATAMQGQYALGWDDEDVVNAIQALTAKDFYKSMAPVHKDFNAWHDVYKSTFKQVELYIKFQIDSRGEMIISFKAR